MSALSAMQLLRVPPNTPATYTQTCLTRPRISWKVMKENWIIWTSDTAYWVPGDAGCNYLGCQMLEPFSIHWPILRGALSHCPQMIPLHSLYSFPSKCALWGRWVVLYYVSHVGEWQWVRGQSRHQTIKRQSAGIQFPLPSYWRVPTQDTVTSASRSCLWCWWVSGYMGDILCKSTFCVFWMYLALY